jgi:hypothetical protein
VAEFFTYSSEFFLSNKKISIASKYENPDNHILLAAKWRSWRSEMAEIFKIPSGIRLYPDYSDC